SRTNRWVALDGEGCFVVNKTKTPFVVKIDSAYSIKVLGTTFNVQAYADDGYIKTTLLNGSVQLNYLSSNNLGHVCFLKESEASLYSRERRTMNIGITDVNVDIAWKYGRIFFDNHSLRQALRVLSRHYNVDFKVLNENVYKSAITGKFDNEQLHQVLNYISKATGIKYKFIKPVITPNGMSKQEIILYK
ncbi:MAG: DUF4974 domain-containing protein, partial [Massilibacteroides sp.]|nr:DUF4974 domain-containing protein [Massilibacteroides sp.]